MKKGYIHPSRRREETVKTARRFAADAMTDFARSGRAEPTAEEVETVEEFMRLAGCDHPDPETRRSCRTIGARVLLRMIERDSPRLTGRAERALLEIARRG